MSRQEMYQQFNEYKDNFETQSLGRRFDDYVREYQGIGERSNNARNAVGQLITWNSGAVATGGAVLGGAIGTLLLPGIGTSAGATVGAAASGALFAWAGAIYFKAQEISRVTTIDNWEQKEKEKFLRGVQVYAESLYQRAQQGDQALCSSHSMLYCEMSTEAILLGYVNDANLPPEVRTAFMAEQLTLLSERVGKLEAGSHATAIAMGQMEARDQVQAEEIRQTQAGFESLGNSFGQLQQSVNGLSERIANNEGRLDEFANELSVVKTDLEEVQGQVAQHETRIGNLEVVTQLLMQEFSKVSTYGLERYYENIDELKTEYSALYKIDPTGQATLDKKAELQSAVDGAKTEIAELELGFNGFFEITNLIMQFGQAIGSVELQRAMQMTQSMVQIGIGIAAMAGVEGLGAIAGGSVLGPIGMVAGGIISLLSAFGIGGNENNAIAEALQHISEQIQGVSDQIEALSHQVANLGKYIGQRFDNLESILYDQRRLIMRTFRETVELLRHFHRSVMTQFMVTQGQINTLTHLTYDIIDRIDSLQTSIEEGFKRLYVQNYDQIITQIVNYYDIQTVGSVAPLVTTEVRQAMLSIVEWATQGTRNPLMHGEFDSDYSLSKLLTIPQNRLLEQVNLFLGILREQGITLSTHPLPNNLLIPFYNHSCELPVISTDRLINPLAFAASVQHILKLITRIPELNPISTDRCYLQQVINSGQHFLQNIISLKTTPAPVNFFLDIYENSMYQFIHAIYRKLVETLEIRGEDIAPDLNEVARLARSKLDSLNSYREAAEIFYHAVNATHQEVLKSCYFSIVTPWWDASEELKSYRDRKYCDGRQLSETYNCDLYLVKPACENPLPVLNSTDCHNYENIFSSKLHLIVFSRAKTLIPYGLDLALVVRLFESVDWLPSSNRFSEINLGDINGIIRLLTPDLLEFNDLNNNGYSAFSTYAPSFFDKYENYESCKLYARYLQLVLGTGPGGRGVYYHWNERDVSQIVLAPLNRAKVAYTQMGRDYEELTDDDLGKLSSLATSVRYKLIEAKKLRMEEFYYHSSPSKAQYKAMLDAIVDWFTQRGSSVARDVMRIVEKNRIIQAILSSIASRESIYDILQNINIAKKGLSLYLDLAFSEELYADEGSQLILKLLFDSNMLIKGLQNHLNSSQELIFETMASQLATTSDTITLEDGTSATVEREFIPDARSYFSSAVTRGQAALNDQQLLPGYSWLVNLLNRVAWYRDYVIPQRNLTFRDITTQDILSAVMHNKTVILDLLDIPKLDLINTRDQVGNTPYLLAAKQCDLDLITALFHLKANTNVLDKNGLSALNLAMLCAFSPTKMRTLKLLLSQGVTDCSPSDELLTAMMEIRNQQPQLLENVTCLSLPSYSPSISMSRTTSISPSGSISKTPSSTASTSLSVSVTPSPVIIDTQTSPQSESILVENEPEEGGFKIAPLVGGAAIVLAGIALGLYFLRKKQRVTLHHAPAENTAEMVATTAATLAAFNQIEGAQAYFTFEDSHASQYSTSSSSINYLGMTNELDLTASWSCGENDHYSMTFFPRNEMATHQIIPSARVKLTMTSTLEFNASSCHPAQFSHRSSAYGEGERYSSRYTPTLPTPLFEGLDGQIMLGRIALHVGNKTVNWMRRKEQELNQLMSNSTSKDLLNLPQYCGEQVVSWVGNTVDWFKNTYDYFINETTVPKVEHHPFYQQLIQMSASVDRYRRRLNKKFIKQKKDYRWLEFTLGTYADLIQDKLLDLTMTKLELQELRQDIDACLSEFKEQVASRKPVQIKNKTQLPQCNNINLFFVRKRPRTLAALAQPNNLTNRTINRSF